MGERRDALASATGWFIVPPPSLFRLVRRLHPPIIDSDLSAEKDDIQDPRNEHANGIRGRSTRERGSES